MLISAISVFHIHLTVMDMYMRMRAITTDINFISTAFSYISQCTADEGSRTEASRPVYCSCYVYSS